MNSNIIKIIDETYDKVKLIKDGKVASYIPQLAKVDPNIFAISFVDIKGNMYSIGDSDNKVAIESISKLFTFSKAVHKFGENTVLEKIGVGGSSLPFNSIIAALESKTHTINPFVNQGAIATTSLFYDKNHKKFKEEILKNLNIFAGKQLKLGEKIYHSESETNNTNMALAYILKSFNRFYGAVPSSVDVYTHQCSVLVSSKDLALMGSVITNNGIHPKTKKHILNPEQCQFIKRVLRPAGLYEFSNTWIVKTGCVAAKSGVGGGILILIPNIGTLAIVSPPLDEYGNSVKGIKAGEIITNKLLQFCKKNKKRKKTKKNNKHIKNNHFRKTAKQHKTTKKTNKITQKNQQKHKKA